MIIASFLSLLVSLVPAASPPVADPPVVLIAAAVHDGKGQSYRPGWIAIADGRILGLGALEDGALPAAAPKGARIVRLEDREIMPGMVDGVGYAGLLSGSSQNEETSEVSPAVRVSRALVAQHPSLQSHLGTGVTTMALQPGSRNVIGGLACLIKTHGETHESLIVRDDLGLRITLGMDPARGNRAARRGRVSMWSRRPASRMSVVFMVRRAFQQAQAYREKRNADSSTPRDAEMDVLQAALEGSLPVYWHARTERDIRTALRLARELRIPNNVILEAHEIDTVKDEVKALGAKVLMGPLYHPQYRGRSSSPFGKPFAQTDGTLWPVRPPTAAEARFLVHQAEHAAGGVDCNQCVVGAPCLVDCSSCAPLADAIDCASCIEGKPCVLHPLTGMPAGDGFAVQAFSGTDQFGIEAGPGYDPDEESRSACLACCGLGFSPAMPDENGWEHMPLQRIVASGVAAGFARGGSTSGETLLDFARFAARAGVDPARAIAMVTSEPARLLGVDDRVGHLAKGLDADLVITSGDPLSPVSGIDAVLVNGRFAFDRTGQWNDIKE